MFENSLSNSKTVIVISDTSIKNNVATSVLHIYSGSIILAKTIHYTINITSTKVESFTVKCSINQAVQVHNVTYISIITDIILSAKQIFDSSLHSYQLQSITIFQDLRVFFSKKTLTTLSSSRIVLAVPNGFIIWLLIKKLNSSTVLLISHINCHGTLARKKNVI